VKVLVTGGAGYIGSVLGEHLLDAGYHVTAVDNLSYGQHGPFHLAADPRYEFVFGDVRDERIMAELVSQADILIPLAAAVGAPLCDRDPVYATTVNLEAVQLLNKLRSPGQRILYPTTNSGYGTQSGEVYCTEDTPLEPISLYGKLKVAAEAEVLNSPNSITLRLATVFGMSPRMRIDLLVNHFVYEAVTRAYLVVFEKDFKRNYVHVRDVADCFVYCIENGDKMLNRPFNLGLDAANLSKEELAEKIQSYVPKFFVHYSELGSDPDKRNYIVSNQRLREAGFEARRTLDDGIKELIKGYRMIGRGQFGNV
jgi:nucleoside-diphosphate-sugar epimerase